MQGGSFTISSIGGIGGTAFTQIVNAPEVAILGATRAATRPVWDGKQFVRGWFYRSASATTTARSTARAPPVSSSTSPSSWPISAALCSKADSECHISPATIQLRIQRSKSKERHPMIKGIDIAAYLVRDPQAQIAFYRDVLGMKPTEIDDQGARRRVHPRRRFDVRRLEARRRGDGRPPSCSRSTMRSGRGTLSSARFAAQRRRGVAGLLHGLRR